LVRSGQAHGHFGGGFYKKGESRKREKSASATGRTLYLGIIVKIGWGLVTGGGQFGRESGNLAISKPGGKKAEKVNILYSVKKGEGLTTFD